MTRSNAKRSRHSATLEMLSDEMLSAATGAGTAKANVSQTGSLPAEAISFSYGHVEWVYTQQR